MYRDSEGLRWSRDAAFLTPPGTQVLLGHGAPATSTGVQHTRPVHSPYSLVGGGVGKLNNWPKTIQDRRASSSDGRKFRCPKLMQ